MKYTQIPTTTFSTLQLNAGILVKSFTTSTGTIGDIIGATSGGISINLVPSFTDFGDDVDNCPKNTKELKKLTSWDNISMSGTFVTVNPEAVTMLLAAGDVDSTDKTQITPRNDLLASDFQDIWFVGDYSDKNGVTNGGFIAIHLKNALNQAGFALTTTDKNKGKFSFEFHAHYSISNPDSVPFEVFVQAGTAEPSLEGEINEII